LLGFLVGDGCLTGKGVSAATGTRENHDRFVAWMRSRLPALHVNEYFHERSWYVGLSSNELADDERYGNRKTKWHRLLDELGLKTKARQKHVPRVIFQAAASTRNAFLAGLLDSDGCFAENSKGVAICFFSSVSNTLLEDMRRLCQLERISVNLRRHRVHLWNLERLQEVVGAKLVIKQIAGRRTAGASVGWVRREKVLTAIAAGESQRGFCERTGINRHALRHSFPLVKSSTASNAGIDLGDVRYFRIAAIERVTDQQFYGMSVADHHNLVGNGVVVKNCYQEQVMRILNRVGGIELADAYKCIKAISKKKEKIIAGYFDSYVQGAVERGVSEQLAKDLFELIKKFAGYGFNKSHSTAYGAVSYQTAYLKAHYPTEFMAALLTCGMEDSARISEHVDDVRRMGITIAPPDVNSSGAEFAVIGERQLSFGMEAIKGLGKQVVQAIADERRTNGFFKNIFDLAERLDPKILQKAVLEILIKAGALDSLGPNRAQHLAAVERAVSAAIARHQDKKRGQRNLFGDDDDAPAAGADATTAGGSLPDAPDWTHSQKLAGEKEVLGFYLTSHPLTQFADTLEQHVTHDNKQLGDLEDGTDVLLGGMIASIKKAITKKPSRNGHTKYVNFDIEDPTGLVRCIMWPEDYARLGEKVQPEAVVFVKGKVDRRGRDPNVIVNQLLTVDEADKQFTTQIAINFQRGLHGERELLRTREILQRYPGKTDVVLIVDSADPQTPDSHLRFVVNTPNQMKVSCSADLQTELTNVIGRAHFQLHTPPKQTRVRDFGSGGIGK
jgi:helix-hairpin-helix protein/OB-fold nucleic acid binding protein/DNA polymerase III alpha subunit/LAGLIDADG DNA endonuclease family protein